MKQALSKTQTILSLYDLKLAKAKRRCSIEIKRLAAAEKKCDQNSQSISVITENLQQKQDQLIKSAQLTQWQAYQAFSNSQTERVIELESQKPKLEFQLAVARQHVDKRVTTLHKLRLKYETIQVLLGQQRRRSFVKINEQNDEFSTQQWQHTRNLTEVR